MEASTTIGQRLRSDKLYVGHPSFQSNVRWAPLWTGSQLAVTGVPGNDAAVIKMICRVSADKLYFQPLGTYERTYDYNQKQARAQNFKDCAKAKFQLGAIRDDSHPDLAVDYDRGVTALQQLQNSRVQPGQPKPEYLIDKSDNGLVALRMNWPLWESKTCYANDSDRDDEDLDVASIEIKRKEIQKARVTANYRVADTYKPAFDLTAEKNNVVLPEVLLASGKKMPPSMFIAHLKNALVEIHFTLRHYKMTDGSNVTGNTMSARLVKMKVVSAADLQLVTGPPLVFPTALTTPSNPGQAQTLPNASVTAPPTSLHDDENDNEEANDSPATASASKVKKSKKRVAETAALDEFVEGSSEGRSQSKRLRGCTPDSSMTASTSSNSSQSQAKFLKEASQPEEDEETSQKAGEILEGVLEYV